MGVLSPLTLLQDHAPLTRELLIPNSQHVLLHNFMQRSHLSDWGLLLKWPNSQERDQFQLHKFLQQIWCVWKCLYSSISKGNRVKEMFQHCYTTFTPQSWVRPGIFNTGQSRVLIGIALLLHHSRDPAYFRQCKWLPGSTLLTPGLQCWVSQLGLFFCEAIHTATRQRSTQQ